MTWRRRSSRSVVNALMGAASGLAASWVMERAQAKIMSVGDGETKRREKEAQDDLEPATVKAAERVATISGTAIPRERMGVASQAVHYATGAAFGAIFGLFGRRVSSPILLAGALYGAMVWLFNDEALVPVLGLSRKPWEYPVSTHAKGLASHLVYGAATGAGFKLMDKTLH